MQTEFEVKVLDIDVEEIQRKLLELGAQHIGNLEFKRYIFNLPSSKEWLRLRTDGKKTTLTYKFAESNKIDGVKEIEVDVSDLESTKDILLKAGLTVDSYQENNRNLFKLNSVEVSVDSWPLIPPYLEIEGPDEVSVRETLSILGLNDASLSSEPTSAIYKHYELDISDYKELKFS